MSVNEKIAKAIKKRDDEIIYLKTRLIVAEQLLRNANRVHEHGELYPEHAGDEFNARVQFLANVDKGEA